MAEIDQEKRDKKYNQWARYYPAIVNLVFPLIVVVFAFFDQIHVDGDLSKTVSRIELITKIILVFGSIVPALFFFYVFFIREISMHLVEWVMDGVFGKTTINILRNNNDTFSEDRKKAIKDKIKKNYDIEIPAETNNRRFFPQKDNFRRRVDEAFDRIRENTRPNAILFEYNCVYGFFRNLSGGLFFNFFILILLCVFKVSIAPNVTGIIDIYWYIIPLLLIVSIIFTRTSGYTYSKRLYIVFLDHEERR